MRIIGGKYGGKKLILPDTLSVRPTGDRAKEALFNILGADILGASVLDLFSGSGALGLEALSRGAKRVVFADIDVRYLWRNINLIDGLKEIGEKNTDADGGGIDIIAGAYDKTLLRLGRGGAAFDIIFLDPPYNSELGERAIALIAGQKLLKPNGKIIFEHLRGKELKNLGDCVIIYDNRQYGIQALSFIRIVNSY
jgi:16S rRNA (guanine966-N2)-methyltransferase